MGPQIEDNKTDMFTRENLLNLLHPAAMGVLLDRGWHVYNEAVTQGVLSLIICSTGIVAGFVANMWLCRNAESGSRQAGLCASLFWASCSFIGCLAFLGQFWVLVAGLSVNSTALAMNTLLSSAFLGLALPHIVPKVLQQPEPEVVTPVVVAIIVAEAACMGSERLAILQIFVTVFLVGAGLHGIADDSIASAFVVDVLRWIAHLCKDLESKLGQSHQANGVASVTPSTVVGNSDEQRADPVVGNSDEQRADLVVEMRKRPDTTREPSKLEAKATKSGPSALPVAKESTASAALATPAAKAKAPVAKVNATLRATLPERPRQGGDHTRKYTTFALQPPSQNSSSEVQYSQEDWVHTAYDSGELSTTSSHEQSWGVSGDEAWLQNVSNGHGEHSEVWDDTWADFGASHTQLQAPTKLRSGAEAFVPSFAPVPEDSWNVGNSIGGGFDAYSIGGGESIDADYNYAASGYGSAALTNLDGCSHMSSDMMIDNGSGSLLNSDVGGFVPGYLRGAEVLEAQHRLEVQNITCRTPTPPTPEPMEAWLPPNVSNFAVNGFFVKAASPMESPTTWNGFCHNGNGNGHHFPCGNPGVTGNVHVMG